MIKFPIVLISLIFLILPFSAKSVRGETVSVKRDIIAFWDSTEADEDEYTFSPIHLYLEPILNHFGLRLTYIDVQRPFPAWLKKENGLEKFLGVVSWFTDNSMKEAKSFMEIIKVAHNKKLKILMLGEPGFFMETPQKMYSKTLLKDFWSHLGFSYSDAHFSNPLLMNLKIVVDEKDVQFERDFSGETPSFWALTIADKKIEPWVMLNTKEEDDKIDFHPVAVGENIAVIQRGYEAYTNPIDFKLKWRMNPFTVIKKLFKTNNHPIPDVTTQCGKRLSFIHIDGDGFINVSLIDKKSLSGEVILNDIIKKYELPTSTSIVTAEISKKYLGNDRTESAVREMFSLPYVEPATHTFRHPLSWEKEPNLREKEIYLKDEEIPNFKGPIVAYEKSRGELNYEEEILGSLKYINEVVTNGQKANTVFWSGSCRPPHEALKLVEENKLLNINGGDGRFDSTYPSYAGLSAHYRKINDIIQPYSGFANENIYTNLWEGPFSGFRQVIESFKNTENPIRVKPINVYYHFYSGERVSSLKALDEIYTYLKSQNLFPIFASDYAQIIKDWDKTEVSIIGSNSFQIKNYGHNRTFRLDQTSLNPDYQTSKNVIGHTHFQNNLYVTLKKGSEAIINLTTEKPKKPYLKECNGFIDQFDENSIVGYSREPFLGIIQSQSNERVIKVNERSFKIEGWKK